MGKSAAEPKYSSHHHNGNGNGNGNGHNGHERNEAVAAAFDLPDLVPVGGKRLIRYAEGFAGMGFEWTSRRWESGSR